MQNRSASVMSSDSDTACYICCCSPCIGLCYLLCLKRMTVSTRLKIVWIWMIFLSLFSGLYIRYNLYDSDVVSITSYDMMPVQKMSTIFCSGVVVSAQFMHQPLAVYLLNNKPHINHTHTVYNSTIIFSHYKKKLFHFYLLAGSSITLTFCSKVSSTLTVIKGTENYEKYLETMDYKKYTMSYNTIFPKCNSKFFYITESNRYYFILAQNWRRSVMELHVNLKKTSYQVHGKDSKLENVRWKVFVPLKFQSTETIIYQPELQNYQELIVTTQCEPMNSFYFGVFLGGFLALGLILSYFVKCLCQDPEPDPLPSTVPLENVTEPTPTSQIHPTAPPLPEDESSVTYFPGSQQAPSCPPPSYESLFADTEPPSYLSTTLELNRK